MKVTFFLLIVVALSVAKRETVEHGSNSHKTAHFKDGIHNPAFDLEALFGSRTSDEFAELADDVKTNRLRNLAKSHDANNDGFIDITELKAWVLQSFRMLDHEDAKEKLIEDDEDGDGMVTYPELLKKQYGYTEADIYEMETRLKEGTGKAEEEDEEREVLRLTGDDKKRFAAADVNSDGVLDHTEYLAFFQPYDHPHMFEVEMERAMTDLDKDNDKFVSLMEFIGDNDDEESKLSEETNFKEYDKNGDGMLDREELRPWALPDNSEIADEECEHLIQEADSDSDGKLSIEEIVIKEEEFLGSSTTDYGRHLHFIKDEL